MSDTKNLVKVASFVDSIINKKPTESEQLFKEIISAKVLSALADKRMEVAKKIFREANEPEFVLINPFEIDPETKKPKVVCSGSKEECMGYKNGVKDPKVKAALKLQAK